MSHTKEKDILLLKVVKTEKSCPFPPLKIVMLVPPLAMKIVMLVPPLTIKRIDSGTHQKAL